MTTVAGHSTFATAGRVLDIAATGADMRERPAWCSAAIAVLWTSGDTEALTREPCAICGEAEGYANMRICNVCNRPSHLQCLNPSRSFIPDGLWYCHVMVPARKLTSFGGKVILFSSTVAVVPVTMPTHICLIHTCASKRLACSNIAILSPLRIRMPLLELLQVLNLSSLPSLQTLCVERFGRK